MKFIIAQHPGRTSPMFMAQQPATFDELSGGRLIINIVNGDDSLAQREGRRVGFVIRLHVIVRDTRDEAWRAVQAAYA